MLCGICTRFLAQRVRINCKRLDLNGLATLRLASVETWRGGKEVSARLEMSEPAAKVVANKP